MENENLLVAIIMLIEILSKNLHQNSIKINDMNGEQLNWINYIPFTGYDMLNQPSIFSGFDYGWGDAMTWIPSADSRPLSNPGVMYPPGSCLSEPGPPLVSLDLKQQTNSKFKTIDQYTLGNLTPHLKMFKASKKINFLMTQFFGNMSTTIRLECEDNPNKSITGALYVINISQMRVEQIIEIEDSTQPILVSNLSDGNSYTYSFMPTDTETYNGVSTGNFTV